MVDTTNTTSSIESPRSVPVAAGAPDEIELTPAMRRAGRKEFVNWSDGQSDPETAAFWIFTAMIEAPEELGHYRIVDRS